MLIFHSGHQINSKSPKIGRKWAKWIQGGHQTEQENPGFLRVSVLAAANAREKGVWRTNDGVCVAISSCGSRLINEQSPARRCSDVCGGGPAGGVRRASICLAGKAIRATFAFFCWVACFQRRLRKFYKIILMLTFPGCSAAFALGWFGRLGADRGGLWRRMMDGGIDWQPYSRWWII